MRELDADRLTRGIQGLRELICRILKQPDAEPDDLSRLRWEISGYLYYMLTLLEVFNDELDKEKLKGARGPEAGNIAFDTLAHVRQYFALNSRLAWLTINDFREAWGLISWMRD